jgi:histidine decarboxylase
VSVEREPIDWIGAPDLGWAGAPEQTLWTRLGEVTARTAQARERVLGFPAATDIDYRGQTRGLLAGLVNNLGDPEATSGRWPVHLLDLEREVIAAALDLFGGDPAWCWGYVTAGGSTEGVLHGLWLGRRRFLPDGAHVYASTAAHYCVDKAADLLGLPLTRVESDAAGRIRPDRLAAAAAAHCDRAALVVATVGTTMTEAVDDVGGIHRALDEAQVSRRHVVVDAALSGPMLAVGDGAGGPWDAEWVAALLAEPAATRNRRTRVDADAVCFSGHKFLGVPLVCGVALARREHVGWGGPAVELIAARDVTVAGSRSGLPVALLWWALHDLGRDGLRERACGARGVAARTVEALKRIGWPAWRHDHACTVVIEPPPEPLAQRWALPVVDGISHLVCVPGVTDAKIARFVGELAAATGRRTAIVPAG